MEERVEFMTDKQFEGMIKMIRGAVEKCKDLNEALEYLNSLLDENQPKKSKES